MGLGLKMFTKPGVHNDFFIAGRCRGRLPPCFPGPTVYRSISLHGRHGSANMTRGKIGESFFFGSLVAHQAPPLGLVVDSCFFMMTGGWRAT